MRFFLKSSFLIVFLAFGSYFLTPISESSSKLSGKNYQTDGKALYLQNCARCHGADGKSQTELGKSLDSPDLTSKKIKKLSVKKVTKVITKGDGAMPAFGKKLSKEEIERLVKYVKTL